MILTRLLSQRRWPRASTSAPCTEDTVLLCEDGVTLLLEDGGDLLLVQCTGDACPTILTEDRDVLLCEDGLPLLLAACAGSIGYSVTLLSVGRLLHIYTIVAQAEPLDGEGDLFACSIKAVKIRGRGRLAGLGVTYTYPCVEVAGVGKLTTPIAPHIDAVASAAFIATAGFAARLWTPFTGRAGMTGRAKLVAVNPSVDNLDAQLVGVGQLSASTPTVADAATILIGTGDLAVGGYRTWTISKAKFKASGTIAASPAYCSVYQGAAVLTGQGGLVYYPAVRADLIGVGKLLVVTEFLVGTADFEAYGDLYAMGVLYDPNATRPQPDGYLYPASETYDVIDCGWYVGPIDYAEVYDAASY